MKERLMTFGKSFLSNFKTILFALVVAVVIWLAISFQLFPNVQLDIEVPVSADLTDYMRDVNLELTEEFNQTVTVSIEGKRYDVAGLGEEDFYAFLDFSEVREAGEYNVPVVIEKRADSNFLITSRNITKSVEVIQTAEKTLWTVPDVQGLEVGEGMTIDYANIIVNPAVITIWGEKSLVDSVYSVRVNAMNFGAAISGIATLSGELVLLDVDGEQIFDTGIHVEDRAFSVTVPIFRHKTLPLEVTIINEPNNFNLNSLYNRMSILPAELTIASHDDSIDKRDSWSLGTVSLNNLTIRELQDGFTIPITLAEGYANMSEVSEARIVFDDIDGYGMMTFNVSSDNFRSINLPPGYEVSYITSRIPVKVVGPSNAIGSMTAADIDGTIDFAGITDVSSGSRTIGMKFTVAGSNVRAWVIDEYRVDVVIKQSDD
jgi:hypothetical protein